MIHSLSVKNFLSIKDKITLSFEATKDKHLRDIHVINVAKDVNLLKLGILFGANASGKSNIINALAFIKDFWFKILNDKEQKINAVPFMLDNESRNNQSEFSLVFYKDDMKYSYFLSFQKNTVISEKLDFYPGVQPANVFERRYEDGLSKIIFGPKIKISDPVKNEINVKCLPNISFFTAYNQVNTNITEINQAVEWMKRQIMPPIRPLTSLEPFTEDMVYSQNECKEKALNYLKEADFNISAIKTNEKEEEITDEVINQLKNIGFPDAEIKKLEKEHKIKIRNTEFEHSVVINGREEYFNIPLKEQSDGTKRMFGLSGAIYKAIKEDAFLAIDEIEAKLHPRLIEYVLQKFLEESKQAQLFVTTHYDNLFDEDDLLRKDNFWFTKKKEDGSTDLYPLHKFNGLNRISSLQKAYKYGKFGAIPNID
ncbi:MAG TPA: ATP-binding protein [bacterium]|nr:ATP-binding protein [bacterium]HPS31073.1 ATP-binding protein [bacterium]